MTNEQRAKAIASEANECCNRSDGWEKAIEAFALKYLQDAYRAGYECALKNYNVTYPEDMGR